MAAADHPQRPWWRIAAAAIAAATVIIVAGVLYLSPADLGDGQENLARGGGSEGARSEITAGTATVVLEAEHISIGIADLLEVTLIVEGPAGSLVTLPKLDGEAGSFEVESRDAIGPVTIDAERRRWMRTYVLEPMEVGTVPTPTMTVIFQEVVRQDRIETHRIDAEPLAIEVTTVLPPDADIGKPRGILGPVPLPEPERRRLWPWIAGGGLALALAAHVASRLARRRQSAERVAEETAEASALAALERLEGAGPADDVEAFHIRISTILRDYTERRFGVPAPYLTTQEVALAAARPEMQGWGDRLTALLGHCDLVKFARLRPSPSAMNETRSAAAAFIHDTSDGSKEH